MKTDQHGQIIFDQQDLCDLVMQGHDIAAMKNLLVDDSVDLHKATDLLENIPVLVNYSQVDADAITTEQFDIQNQKTWFMPRQYCQLDIAEHVLSLCNSDAELQRCGHELLLFQERGLFDLLRYLKYLVDVMTQNQLIWGVGRGSSVASYVLYKMGVHKIDSLHYDLDPSEFLR